MKKLLILAALLTVGAGAFAQAKAGSLGVTASLAADTGAVGLDYYVQESLSVDLKGLFSLKSETGSVIPDQRSDSAYTKSTAFYGVNTSLYYHLPAIENLDLGFGPGGSWNFQEEKTVYATQQSSTLGTHQVLYGTKATQTVSYGGTLALQAQYFLSPRFAFVATVGGLFQTSMKQDVYYASTGGTVLGNATSSYEFKTSTPSLGVVFYLN